MIDRRPPGARASASAMLSKRPTTPLALRFPCGHLEDQPAVTARLHATPGALWIACRHCNLIVLATARPPGARRSSATLR